MRLGKFVVTESLLENESPELEVLFDEMEILDSRASFDQAACVEFLCAHPEFDDINEGDVIPSYKCNFTQSADGTITRHKLIKV